MCDWPSPFKFQPVLPYPPVLSPPLSLCTHSSLSLCTLALHWVLRVSCVVLRARSAVSSASSIFQSNASSAFAWSLSSSVSFDQPSRLWLPLPPNLLRRAFNFNCNSSITIVSPYENISDYCKVKVHLHVTSSTNQLLYTKLQYQLLPISFYLPSYSINWLIICSLHEVYSCREYEIFSQFVEPCQSVSRLYLPVILTTKHEIQWN